MAKRQSGAKMVKKVAIKKVDDSNLVVSQEIRAALIEMNDHQASSKAVAQFLREKHPNSAKVAKATSGTAWSIYVSNER
ncbi:MAG: hypothetical protein FJ267_12195, partial [Planctomycetes bacterium]|nr:hypothetical protein [Planctomycetota bacterium]